MRFGICSDFSNALNIKQAGFDYIELPLNKIGTMTESEFEASLKEFEKVKIPAEACSLLLPKTMQIIGQNYNEKEIDNYLHVAFSRMNKLGASVVSFGSGKSRFIPENMNYGTAFLELVNVTSHICDIASLYSIEIAIEPLNRGETNLINSLTEGASLASLTGAGLLVDAFHVRKENEPISDISLCSPFSHAHIATLNGRKYPLEKNDEILEFVSILKQIGYDKRLSIEGKTDDFCKDAPKALCVLKEAFQEVF